MSDVQIMILTGIFMIPLINLIVALIDKMNEKNPTVSSVLDQ